MKLQLYKLRFWLTCLFLSVFAPAWAAPGHLDPSFGIGGKQFVDIGQFDFPITGRAYDMALQSDDKIVLVGAAAPPPSTGQIAVVRLNADGTTDSSFGTHGQALFSINETLQQGERRDVAYAVALQRDGKIVVAGSTYKGNYFHFAAARLNTNGTLDASFAGDGTLDTGFVGFAYGVALQNDGKIVLAGGSYQNFAVLRLNANGSLDNSFSDNGLFNFKMGFSTSYAQAVAVQSDGKILLGGTAKNPTNYEDFAVARLNSDGTFDLTFNGNGRLVLPFTNSGDVLSAMQWQNDGKILVAGTVYNGGGNFGVARLNANGSLDTSFSGDGKVLVDFGAGNFGGDLRDLTRQPDGKIIVVGAFFYGSAGGIATARLKKDGSLDSTFSGDGKSVLPADNDMNVAEAVAVQRDGKIVLAGQNTGTPYPERIGVRRLTSDGAADSSFANGRVSLTNVGHSDDLCYDMALQSDGKIVMVGRTTLSINGVYTSGVARLNADGTPDASFDSDGKLKLIFDNATTYGFVAVAVQDDDKILLAGTITIQEKAYFAVARLNVDGSLDSTFNGDGKLTLAVGATFSQAFDLDVQSDGKILVAGVGNAPDLSPPQFAVVRLNSDGTLDTSFDGDGRLLVSISDNGGPVQIRDASIALQSDGKIVLAGSDSSYRNSFAAARLRQDGSLDTTFSEDGTVVFNPSPFQFSNSSSQCNDVVVQKDGKIVFSGTVNGQMVVVRLTVRGQLDPAFSNDGRFYETALASANGIALQSDGRIVVVGTTIAGLYRQMSVVRLTSSGGFDTSFSNGKIDVPLTPGELAPNFEDSSASAVAIQTNGRIVVAGYSQRSLTSYDFAVARLIGRDAMLSIADAPTTSEGSSTNPGAATFTLMLNEPAVEPVSVHFATTDSTAHAGSDYVAKSGTLSFAPGETQKTVRVRLVGDGVAEEKETFFMILNNPINATLTRSHGSCIIEDNDGPLISIDNATTVNEGNSGVTLQFFRVNLSAPSPNSVTVSYATAEGTATGDDYISSSGTLTFAPGIVTQIIAVQVKGDTMVEPNETYRVNLSSPTFAVLVDSQGIGYIRNDDTAALHLEEDAPSS